MAAGELATRDAILLGVGCLIAGLVLCDLVRPLLVAVGAGYVALTLSYTMVWRHLLLLDIVAIGGGFVLRAVAGGVAAPVALSRWFLRNGYRYKKNAAGIGTRSLGRGRSARAVALRSGSASTIAACRDRRAPPRDFPTTRSRRPSRPSFAGTPSIPSSC